MRPGTQDSASPRTLTGLRCILNLLTQENTVSCSAVASPINRALGFTHSLFSFLFRHLRLCY